MPTQIGSGKSYIKLNLGCGFNTYEGYVNVDSAPECKPDVVWDLEQTPWPWEDDSVEEIRMEHVLEHLGETSKIYLAIWEEMYRICRNGAHIKIMVPHWRHENFYHDPTHARAVTPEGIGMFDQAKNIKDIASGDRSTKLGLFTGIDIELRPENVEYFYTGKLADEVKSGTLTYEGLQHLREHQNNISNEVRMTARVVKPPRGGEWLARQGL